MSKRPKYYYGIFKVSPNVKPEDIKYYQPGDYEYQWVKERVEFKKARHAEKLSSMEWSEGAVKRFEQELEEDLFDLTVRKEHEVFYICDSNFNLIEETYELWNNSGNFSKAVHALMRKYGIKGKDRIRTESTIKQLQESVEIHERLNAMPDSFWDDVSDALKGE